MTDAVGIDVRGSSQAFIDASGIKMISPVQCRLGRSLAELSAIELAARAGVGIATIKRFESGQAVQAATINAVEIALTAAGITFIAAGESSPDGGEGVRLSATAPR